MRRSLERVWEKVKEVQMGVAARVIGRFGKGHK